MENFKYTATLTIKKLGDFAFIGKVSANSKKELKEQARIKARSWNNYGRIYVSESNVGLEFCVNA